MNDVEKNIPELLAPVGDFDRLYAAVRYGADAVYLGGSDFGMRTAAASFGGERLAEAVSYAHAHSVRVYLTCNTLPHNSDIDRLPQFLESAQQAGVDALIVTDMGVLTLAKKYCPSAEIHISTQAGIVNYAAANAFYDMGAKRVVLARELSLDEIARIRAMTPPQLEIECFVHGAMCVSFSGRCLLSNYLAGRDSNRGDCAQPCRWKYSLVEEKRPGQSFEIQQTDGTYILNSKDMCLIEHIPELINAGIGSFKIEGRAKGEYYTAVVTNAYRHAIDGYLRNPTDDYRTEQWIVDETKKISFRDYCTGFYFDEPLNAANVSYEGGYKRLWDVVASVDSCSDGMVYCTQRNRFFVGSSVEVLQPGVKPFSIQINRILDDKGQSVEAANRAMMKFSFPYAGVITPGSYLRIYRP